MDLSTIISGLVFIILLIGIFVSLFGSIRREIKDLSNDIRALRSDVAKIEAKQNLMQKDLDELKRPFGSTEMFGIIARGYQGHHNPAIPQSPSKDSENS